MRVSRENSLEEAAQLIARGQPKAAVAPLLGLWRSTRSPTIANALDLLEPQPEVADRCAALARMPLSAAQAALERLSEAPEDPRTTAPLIELLKARPFTQRDSGDFWELLLLRLVQLSDVRALAPLRRLREAELPAGFLKELFFVELPRAINGLGRQLGSRPSMAPEVLCAAKALLDGLRPAPASLEALRARALEDLDDIHARQIYADALMERGDPEGELIALQCARSTNSPASERELALQQSLVRDSAIALVCGEERLVYKRGFLTEVTIVSTAWRNAPLWELALAERGWDTVQRLHVWRWASPQLLKMLLERTRRSLRELSVATPSALRATSGVELSVRALSLHGAREQRGWGSGSGSEIAQLSCLSEPRWRDLRSLSVPLGRYEPSQLVELLELLEPIAQRRGFLLLASRGRGQRPELVERWLQAVGLQRRALQVHLELVRACVALRWGPGGLIASVRGEAPSWLGAMLEGSVSARTPSC